MYFQAECDWEITSPLMKKFIGAEKKAFDLIELGYNFNIFLVDADVNDDEDTGCHVRFLFGNIKQALAFMSQEVLVNAKIAIMSRRCDNGGSYSVSDIHMAIEANDNSGQIGYIYKCKNGKEYVDSLSVKSAAELINKRTIYLDNPPKE